MTNYRRNFLPGGSYFFTVNLAERRLRLLTERADLLRAAFRYTRKQHPFTIEAIVVLPDHLHAVWTLPEISQRDGVSSRRRFHVRCQATSGFPKLGSARKSGAFGSGAIGSTPC